MKHYLTNNEIRAIEDGQEFLVKADWVLLSDEELYARLNPPKTEEQLLLEWKASRLEAVSKIVVEVSTGKKFNGDEDSQARMGRTWPLMADGGTTKWSLADTPTGFMTIVTKEELKEACKLAGEAQTALWEYK